MRRTVVAFLPLGLWAAAVLMVGSLEITASPLPAGADKAAHFAMYGIGGALAAWAGRKQGSARAAWAALTLVLLTGVADELRQARLPTRDGDPVDWMADAVGAFLLFLITDRLLKRD